MADKLLHEVHMDITMQLLPVIVSTLVFTVIGIIGNILVIAFYVRTPKRTVPTLLIRYLAIADLASCLSAIPIMIEMAINVRYTQSFVCKFTHFLGNWAVAASIYLLMVICVDRYRKICKSFGTQITVSGLKYIVIAIFLLSLLNASKNWVVFDIVEVNVTALNTNETLTGYVCSAREDGVYARITLGGNLVDITLVVIIWLSIIITYARIIFTLLKRRYKMLRSSSTETQNSWRSKKRSSSKCNETFDKRQGDKTFTNLERQLNKIKDGSGKKTSDDKAGAYTIVGKEQKKNCESTDSQQASNDNGGNETVKVYTITDEGKKKPESSNNKSMSENKEENDTGNVCTITADGQNKTESSNNLDTSENKGEADIEHVMSIARKDPRKSKSSVKSSDIRFDYSSVRKPSEWNLTLLMFTVSLVFILCFIPYFFTRVFVKFVLDTTTRSHFVAWIQFGLKSPYFNSIFNPLLYCVFNERFRLYVKNSIFRCKNR